MQGWAGMAEVGSCPVKTFESSRQLRMRKSLTAYHSTLDAVYT